MIAQQMTKTVATDRKAKEETDVWTEDSNKDGCSPG